MKEYIVIIGMGQLASVFAQGFLQCGIPVVPVSRGMDFQKAARDYPEPELVLLAVAEKDFHPAMEKLPAIWKNKLTLLQNELLPRDWQQYGVVDPTAMAVWFEKKKGRAVKVLLPTQIFGPKAGLTNNALQTLDIPVAVLDSPESLEYELVLKNLFVFTINIVGLEKGGTTGVLWTEHRDLTRRVFLEVLKIQEMLIDKHLPQERLLARFTTALNSDPEHTCRGRAAPDRLARLLALADKAKIPVPTLRSIHIGKA
ncbi:MAG: hypothetical protein JRF02_05660 [Deltaproteobacteria bacterium]|jgi:hypothetical protein|nr:hypothetical protein [Deltaproteobacteria bacterium]